MWAEAQLLTAGLSNAAFLEKYKKHFSSVSCILPAVLPWLPFGAFVLMFFCFLTLLNLFFLSLLKCLITLSGFSFLNQRKFLPRKVLEKWFCLAYFFFFPARVSHHLPSHPNSLITKLWHKTNGVKSKEERASQNHAAVGAGAGQCSRLLYHSTCFIRWITATIHRRSEKSYCKLSNFLPESIHGSKWWVAAIGTVPVNKYWKKIPPKDDPHFCF